MGIRYIRADIARRELGFLMRFPPWPRAMPSAGDFRLRKRPHLSLFRQPLSLCSPVRKTACRTHPSSTTSTATGSSPPAKTQDVINPANSKPIGELGHASKGDLDKALAAADKGFKTWRKVSAFERGKILRKAADLVRARADEIAKVLTQEQGKILAEAKMEVLSAADIIDWFAGEGQRAYGRIIPARADGVRNMVIMEPIGPVAGFSPWNFPVTQAVRKIAASLAAGCSIIIKCPEETPGSPIGLVKCFHDAGVPAGRHQPRLRRAGRDLGVPDPAPDHPQGLVHRLGAGRQASERAGGEPHEARHHGARRPCAGAGVRRRRRGGRGQADGRLQVSQRRPGLRVADPLLRARQGL